MKKYYITYTDINDRTLDITSCYPNDTTDQQVIDTFDTIVLDRKTDVDIIITSIELVDDLIEI